MQRQAVEQQIDHRGGEQGQHLAEHQTADHADPQRTPQLGADAGAQHQRQGAEQGGEGSHQDRPKTQQTGLVDRLPRRHALLALSGQREVDHHDGVFLDDADQQYDADNRDNVQFAPRQPQRQQRAHARRRQGGENRYRVNKAFIQYPEDDIHRHYRSDHQPDGAAQRRLESQRAALELGADIAREFQRLFGAKDGIDRIAQRIVIRHVKRDGGDRELIEMVYG